MTGRTNHQLSTSLTTKQVANLLDIQPSTWRSYVNRGTAPEPSGYYDGRTPYWDLATILIWDREQEGHYPNIPYGLAKMNLDKGIWLIHDGNIYNEAGTKLHEVGGNVLVKVGEFRFPVQTAKVINL